MAGGSVKVYALPVDMVCWFEKTAVLHSVRSRMSKEDKSEAVIKVDKVIVVNKDKLAGSELLVYRCQSKVENTAMVLR